MSGAAAVKRIQRGEVLFQRPVEADIDAAEFIYLRDINIHMNDFGIGRKGVEFTRRAVIKTRADNDQQSHSCTA